MTIALVDTFVRLVFAAGPSGPSGTNEATALVHINPCKCAFVTLYLVDQHQFPNPSGAARPLTLDDEIRLLGIEFHSPMLAQHRLHHVVPVENAYVKARRVVRESPGSVQAVLEPPQGFGRGGRPIIEF